MQPVNVDREYHREAWLGRICTGTVAPPPPCNTSTDSRHRRHTQGMGLYTKVPGHASFRNVAHDGWLCTVHLLFNNSWKFHQFVAGRSWQGNWYGTEKADSTARPSRTKSHLPGHSPPASQAGRRLGPGLYSLQPHCSSPIPPWVSW